MTHRLARAGVVALASAALAAACGGKVDGASGTSFTTREPPGATTPGRPPSGGRPTRPPVGPVSTASVASQIAEAYCKTFSSCCVGSGQPPIDVARCRELTSKDIEKKLDATGLDAAPVDDVMVCVESIRARTAACGKDDSKWWEQTTPALFGPSSIRQACEPLLGAASKPAPTGTPCSVKMECAGGNVCAIDECVGDNPVGKGCLENPRCVDGSTCTGGTCQALPGAAVNAPCAASADCRLGLVCAKQQCAAAREHPELYEERHSPYRVGADTCSAFTTL
ncbi:MAG: hypothetical protein JWP87_3673 [Labilithrix sp.]|nr:hypothetical protein [Labilithrix sp.]